MVKYIKSAVLAALCLVLLLGCTKSETRLIETKKHLRYNMEASMDAMTVSWKKRDDTHHYKIYRADVTHIKLETDGGEPAAKEYAYLADLPGDQSSYQDENVEFGHYYTYLIYAYDEKNQLVISSYQFDNCDFQATGLPRPDFFNAGYGEDYMNTIDHFYFYAFAYNGVEPDGYILYRKKAQEEDYQELGRYPAEQTPLSDTTMTPGETYDYRVQSYKKVKGEEKRSDYSEDVRLSAVNGVARFDVDVLTKDGDTSRDVVFKMTSHKYNGDLTLKPPKYESIDNTLTIQKKAERTYYAHFSEYSEDGKTWQEMPSEGVVLQAEKALYVKVRLEHTEDTSGEIIFNRNCEMMMDNSCVDLVSSGDGYCVLTIDFKKGTGRAYLDFD